jgi:4-amino-4-deoxy-L-arabinose transferase-like glycosyltransferase
LKTQSETSAYGRWPVPPRSLVIIFALALGMRLLALWSFVSNRGKYWLFSHPYEMGLVANSLIHGHGYSSPFGGSTGPTAIVAPGYPTLIAAVFLAFGSDTFASALVIMGLQILVSLITIWLMMHIARKLFDTRTAIVAGAFWVSLPLIWIPTIFWETSISACAFVAMVALAIRCRREPTRALWILFGASAGIAALINPALLPSLVAIMGWAAWETRRLARTAAVIGLLTLLLVYAPWPIRNAVRFHAFIPMRSTVGLEMYMGNRPGATGRLDESILPMTNPREFASFTSMGEIAYTHNRSVEASAYIRAHPLIFLKLSARRVYRFWTGTGNADGSPFYAVHAALTAIFGFAGIVLIYRRRMRAYAILFALPLLLFPFPYYITHAEFRYRLNIDALLTIPAAYAVAELAAAWSRRKSAKQAARSAKPTLAGSTAE